jgi:hypothetical protein
MDPAGGYGDREPRLAAGVQVDARDTPRARGRRLGGRLRQCRVSLAGKPASASKGLIGPWAHKYPHFAKPGPRIGFLQECLRWWDHWLKGHETGIMSEPMLRAWLEGPSPPRSHQEEKSGRWVAEPVWPAKQIANQRWPLAPGRLANPRTPAHEGALPIRSPQTLGLASAAWYTLGLGHDQPTDQRVEAGGSLCFDTDISTQDIEILGAPIVDLEASVDRPSAFVACTLSEIMPDQSVARVSYGLLNLTHRDSHEHPTPLVPGRLYKIQVRLNEAAHRFAAGNRLRLAISTAFWPIVWPSPEPVMLSVHLTGSGLQLPMRPKRAEDASLAPFLESAGAPPLRRIYTTAPHEKRTITTDVVTGLVEWFSLESEGTVHISGVRHFSQEFTDAQSYRDYTFPTNLPATPHSSPASKTVGKIDPSYEYAKNQFVYALWSQGFRRGGANSVPLSGPFQESPVFSTYQPDKTNNYEAGLKGRFSNGLSYTVAVFDIKWDKPQISSSLPSGNLAVYNANTAES